MASRGLLSTVGLGAQGALRFVTSLLVGRFLGPGVLGVFQTAVSTATLLTLLWPTTAGSAASKFVARAHGAGRPAEAEAVARHLRRRTVQTTALLAVIAVPLWMAVSGDADLWGGLCVAAVVIGYSGYNFARGLQFGLGHVARATAWDLVVTVGGLVTVLLALLAGVRNQTLLLPMAVAYLVYTVAGWPHGSGEDLERGLRREIDGFVALGVAGTIASAGFLQLSMVVAQLAGTADEAGQYAAALTLATPASLLAGSFSLVLFPAMAAAWGRGDTSGFRRQTDQAMRLLVTLMVAVFGSIALCSRLIVSILWGDEYVQAGQLLPILLLAVLPTTIAMACVNALSTRSQRGMAIVSAASISGLAVGAVGWLLLAPTYGETGVAVGYLMGTLVIASIPVTVVWVRDQQHWGWMLCRLGLGVGVLVGLLVVQRSVSAPLWLDLAWAAGFVAVWAAVAWRDTRLVVGLLSPLVRR